MGEGTRMVVGGRAYDGSPLSWADDAGMLSPGVTASSESDQWLADEMNLALEARLSARRVIGNQRVRVQEGRATHAPMLLRPVFGPDAPTRPVRVPVKHPLFNWPITVASDYEGAQTEQVVPRIRIDWL